MHLFQIFFAFIAVYLFIFAPRLAVGGFNTGLVVLLGLAVAAAPVHRRLTLPKPVLVFSGILIFVALYNAALAEYFGNNPTYFLNISTAVIISVMFAWLFAEVLAAHGVAPETLLDTLMVLLVLVIFANSLVIVCEFFFPAFKATVEGLQYQDPGANIKYAEHAFRFRGFSSAGGAGLSILNALGVLLAVFLVLWRRLNGALGLTMALVMVASNVFTGRTGLIFGILFLAVMLAMILGRSMLSGVKGMVGGLLLIAGFVVTVQLVMNIQLDAEISSWAFEWVDGLMSGEVSSSSSDDLGTMLFLPHDVVHLLFGVGFFEGVGVLYPRSDSGYVKTVLSIGVLFGSVLYATIAWLFAQMRKVDRRYTSLVVAVLAFMFFVEIKEPFLYQNSAARLIFLLGGGALFLVGLNRNADRSHHRRP